MPHDDCGQPASISSKSFEYFYHSAPSGLTAGDASFKEAREVQRKILEAIAFLNDVDPGIAAFVQREIATLIVRNDSKGCATGSSSSPEYIGQAVMWNAHLDTVCMTDIADQMLHEAIHCHSYRVELRAPFLAVPIASTTQLASPWSGRRLTIHSYIHAWFVSYGLANFWLTALRRRIVPERSILPHLTQSLKGFETDPMDIFSQTIGAITETALAAISEMHRSIGEILSRHGRPSNL